MKLNHHRLEGRGFDSRSRARLRPALCHSSSTFESPSSLVTSCVRRYSVIASCVMTPEPKGDGRSTPCSGG
jgi:hypothetical protein